MGEILSAVKEAPNMTNHFLLRCGSQKLPIQPLYIGARVHKITIESCELKVLETNDVTYIIVT